MELSKDIIYNKWLPNVKKYILDAIIKILDRSSEPGTWGIPAI